MDWRWFQQGLMSPSTRVRLPLPRLVSTVYWCSGTACGSVTAEVRVRPPYTPLLVCRCFLEGIPPWYGGGPGSTPGRTSRGCWSFGNDAGIARRKTGFDSPAVHCCLGGETEIISRFEREVPGSIPGRGAG